MDRPINTPERAAGSSRNETSPPAEERRQGAMGGRPVSESTTEARVPPMGEGREAGNIAGAAHQSLQARRTVSETSSVGGAVTGSGARAYRRAPPGEIPREDGEGTPEIELSHSFAKRIKLDAVSGGAELPWLTPDQNADRLTLHGRLTEMQRRGEVPSQLKDDLDLALGLVSRLEQDMLRADELLSGLRTRILSEAEWRELTCLVERARFQVPSRCDRTMDKLDRLVESDVLSAAEAGLLKKSLQQLVAAHQYLTAEDLPWRDVARRVQMPLPAGVGTTAVVESRVIPGTAFGSYLARGYSSNDTAGMVERAVSAHVPGLAQTTLTNAAGQMLFSGLRQGFIGVPGLDQGAIRRLSDEDLSRLVSEVVLGPRRGESPADLRRRVADRCASIRSFRVEADRSAMIARHQVVVRMALESAAAAVVADPDKLQLAREGEAVDVKLFNVSLLARNDAPRWAEQYGQHHTWSAPRQLSLVLRDPNGEPCEVEANASVRQFALAVEDVSLDFSALDELRRGVVRLLGDPGVEKLGGDVLERVESLRSRAQDLGRECTAAGYERFRTLPPQAFEHAGGLEARNRFTGLQVELSRLERNARALEQAGHQLKDMWRDEDKWPTGDEAYAAASRLALVAYLMGETPVLSCSSGRDLTGHLDAEVKILATVANCQNGHVPPATLDMADWDPTRAVLMER